MYRYIIMDSVASKVNAQALEDAAGARRQIHFSRMHFRGNALVSVFNGIDQDGQKTERPNVRDAKKRLDK